MSKSMMDSPTNRAGIYLLLGALLGVTFTKSEVISWFRIQEMFRFQSFHMYGVIGSAILVGMVSVHLIKRRQARDLDGNPISIPPKMMEKGTRYWLGGTLFGLGWALTGACPGPMFALVGNGMPIMLATITAALVGTWTYGWLRPSLPH